MVGSAEVSSRSSGGDGASADRPVRKKRQRRRSAEEMIVDTHLASEKSEALLQKEKELLENPDVNLFKTDVQGAIDKLHEERTEKDLKLLVNHSRRLHCLCNMSDDELKTLCR